MTYYAGLIFLNYGLLREESKSSMCVKHNHNPKLIKFLGEKQTKYQKKLSSLELFNCAKCKPLQLTCKW